MPVSTHGHTFTFFGFATFLLKAALVGALCQSTPHMRYIGIGKSPGVVVVVVGLISEIGAASANWLPILERFQIGRGIYNVPVQSDCHLVVFILSSFVLGL